MTLPVWQVSPMDFGLVQQTGASDSYGLAESPIYASPLKAALLKGVLQRAAERHTKSMSRCFTPPTSHVPGQVRIGRSCASQQVRLCVATTN